MDQLIILGKLILGMSVVVGYTVVVVLESGALVIFMEWLGK